AAVSHSGVRLRACRNDRGAAFAGSQILPVCRQVIGVCEPVLRVGGDGGLDRTSLLRETGPPAPTAALRVRGRHSRVRGQFRLMGYPGMVLAAAVASIGSSSVGIS